MFNCSSDSSSDDDVRPPFGDRDDEDDEDGFVALSIRNEGTPPGFMSKRHFTRYIEKHQEIVKLVLDAI